MEHVIVGRLRKERDLLQRECAITSDLDYTIHAFANRSIDVQPVDDNHSIPEDFGEKYEMGTGLIHELPPGIKVERAVELLPEQQIFMYLASVRADVGRRIPLALTGTPLGGSGRLQDIAQGTALKEYEVQKKNTENAFATAFGMALEMFDKVPGLRPDEISEGDVGKVYQVAVELKGEDPIERDRQKTMGSRLYQQGEIDLMTNLVEYQGYTQEKAREIITNIMVDRATFNSPAIGELMGIIAADEMGMSEEYDFIRQKRQQMEKQALMPQPSPTEQQRRTGETKTPLGREMGDAFMSGVGQRRSPGR